MKEGIMMGLGVSILLYVIFRMEPPTDIPTLGRYIATAILGGVLAISGAILFPRPGE